MASLNYKQACDYHDTSIAPIDLREEGWKKESNCQGLDTEAFFPVSRGAYEYKDMLAKVCGACPVKQQCLDYAVKYNLLGWWGGTTDRQRRIIRAERKTA
jgi:WhiB family redox-sensing transcriptional regulator